jgi:hypothetical protein
MLQIKFALAVEYMQMNYRMQFHGAIMSFISCYAPFNLSVLIYYGEKFT